jgi:hypothetical protein
MTDLGAIRTFLVTTANCFVRDDRKQTGFGELASLFHQTTHTIAREISGANKPSIHLLPKGEDKP